MNRQEYWEFPSAPVKNSLASVFEYGNFHRRRVVQPHLTCTFLYFISLKYLEPEYIDSTVFVPHKFTFFSLRLKEEIFFSKSEE